MLGLIKKLLGMTSESGLTMSMDDLLRKVAGLKRPALRLQRSERPSRSKFGGRPLVESTDFIWPQSRGKPMVFLAQIDLAEMAQVHQYDWLAKEGTLLFFYDVIEMPWGFDPKDRGKWRVLYQADPKQLTDYPTNFDDELKIKEVFIKPVLQNILPCIEHEAVERLGLNDEEADGYIELSEPDAPAHQLGGYPTPIQGNDMALESQLASNGVYVGNASGFASPEAKALEPGAKDWRLLLQFDSDDDLDLMWGDCGMLYFWVQEQKAKLNEFDDCWLVLQCS